MNYSKLLIGIIGLTYINSFFIFRFYWNWLKKNKLEICFPKWKGTKKPMVYFLTWSSLLFGDLIIFVWIMTNLRITDGNEFAGAFFFICMYLFTYIWCNLFNF